MNLAYFYPVIFWNCACLIADSGGSDDNEEDEEIVDIYEQEDMEEFEYIDSPDRKTKIKKRKNNNYGKIATAIGALRADGINIVPPDINSSSYTFYPDVENNQILFGLRGLLNVGEEVIADTIANRPYSSPRDYLNKVKPKKTAMVSLIKCGAFDNMMDRKTCMAWYLWEICDKKNRLTLQNMPSFIKYNLLPQNTEEEIMGKRIYEFNRYLKAITKDSGLNPKEKYLIDERAANFLTEIEMEGFVDTSLPTWTIQAKIWDKFYQNKMNVFRKWLAQDGKEILQKLNEIIFMEEWNKYAGKANYSAWEMEAMCYYYHDHELKNLNKEKYGLVDFFELPEEPEIDRVIQKKDSEITLFKLSRIYGTCIAKNKSKATVTLLTPTGTVLVKFRKEYYAMFDKRISEPGSDGKNHIVEKSWFDRGKMIVVCGMRSGDNFIAKKYSTTSGHTLYRISNIDENGQITLQSERYNGGTKESE